MKRKINTQICLVLAKQNIEEGRDIEALCLLEKAISINENCSEAHAYLGWVMAFQFGDLPKGETHLRKAFKQLPNDPFVVVSFISILRKQKKYSEALEIIAKTLESESIEPADLYYELGLNKEMQSKQNEAIQAFKNAIRYSTESTQLEKIEEAIYRCELKISIS